MPRIPARRMTRLDLACAISLAACCLAVFDATLREFAEVPQLRNAAEPWSRWPGWVHRRVDRAIRIEAMVQPSLVMACLGLTGIALGSRLVRPIAPGPGHVAILLATLLTLIWIARFLLFQWIDAWLPVPPGTIRDPFQTARFFSLWQNPTPWIGWAQVAAWITLAISGGWRGSEDWTDWLGRGVGWAWILDLGFKGALWLIHRA